MQTALDLARDIIESVIVNSYLGGDIGGVVDLFEQPAKRFLGFSLTILRRGVEPVDPMIQRPANGGAPCVVVGVDQYSARPSAAERNFGYIDAATAKSSVVHAVPLCLLPANH